MLFVSLFVLLISQIFHILAITYQVLIILIVITSQLFFDMTYFVRKPERRILKFIIVLKQDCWLLPSWMTLKIELKENKLEKLLC